MSPHAETSKGLAEKHAEIIALYLGTGRKPTKAEYERSKAHGIPPDFNPGGSMNWWVLAVALRMAYGDTSEWEAAVNRFHKENTQWGVWGSEQHSPNYWAFHLMPRLAMVKIKGRAGVLDHQIGDLLTYARHAESLRGDEIFWAGMRGTGLPEFSSYELLYLYKRASGQRPPKKKNYWKQDQYKWITDRWVNKELEYYYNSVSAYNRPLPIRSPTHFMEWGRDNKWVYTEDDQHSSTVFRGGGGFLNGRRIAAPANYQLKNRGEGASSSVTTEWNPDTRMLRITYSGPYNEMPDRQPLVFNEVIPFGLTKHLIWDTNGLRNVLTTPLSAGSPAQSAAGEEPKQSRFRRFLNLFSS